MYIAKKLTLFLCAFFCFMSEIHGMEHQRSKSAPNSPSENVGRRSRRKSTGSLPALPSAVERRGRNHLTGSDPSSRHPNIMWQLQFSSDPYADMHNNQLCPTIDDCTDFACCCLSAPYALAVLLANAMKS